MTARVLAATVLVGFLGLGPSVTAAEPNATADRVAVLDAGTFRVVEAREAPLGEVLSRLASHLSISFVNTEGLDLSRLVDGRRTGTMVEIVQWLVPDRSFVLLYEERTPHDGRPPRLERIGFLNVGNDRTSAAAVDALPGGTVTQPPVSVVHEKRSAHVSKTDAPAGPTTEIKTVTEQLRAATPAAQLRIERELRDPTGESAPPEFLRPRSDAAQTTLRQQAERSQALAVEQLRALMEAYGAACRRSGGDSPC